MNTPHRASKPYRNGWQLNDERISHLNACAAQGMPLAAAARELQVHVTTIKKAAEREEKEDWLREKFPRKAGLGGGNKRVEMAEREGQEIRWLKPEQIAAPLVVPNNPQTRWLTKEWRSVA